MKSWARDKKRRTGLDKAKERKINLKADESPLEWILFYPKLWGFGMVLPGIENAMLEKSDFRCRECP